MPEAHLRPTQPPVKRRKVRKGTQSCWECRRRKVRCVFNVPTNPSCDNCKRRKAICISQEDADGPMPSAGIVPIESRLHRVEELIEQLINNGDNTAYTPTSSPKASYKCGSMGAEPRTRTSGSSNYWRNTPRLAVFETEENASNSRNKSGNSTVCFPPPIFYKHTSNSESTLWTPSHAPSPDLLLNSSGS